MFVPGRPASSAAAGETQPLNNENRPAYLFFLRAPGE
jgi:hypothetical protein